MSEDMSTNKKSFLERTTTRREFLKLSGKSLAGAVASFSILGLFTSNADAHGFAMAQGLVIHEPSRCTGCGRCEVVCTMFNDGKTQPYISRVKMSPNYNFGPDGVGLAYWREDGEFGNFKLIADTCRQCKEPHCGNACPVGAIYADEETGARVVNAFECVGCGTCTKACPWHLPTVDPETRTSTKCTLCGGNPSCVANCPTGALKLIPWKEVAAVVKRNRTFAV